MKAIICNNPSTVGALEVGELPQPTPLKDEVMIEVSYAGVNYPDILIAEGKYQFKPDLPFSPGGEVSGFITSVGENVTQFSVGDKVCAAMSWGGFAEFVVAKASNTYLLTETSPLDKSAILLETYATAFHALKDRGTLRPKETIAVLGAAGGTGVACIQLAKLLGAKVIAICSTEDKCQFALDQGAHQALNSQVADIKAELKALGGIDVVFDPVGGELSEACFRSLRPGGRHLVVGFASGKIPNIPWNLPLLKSASIVGVFWGNFWRNNAEQNNANVQQLLAWLDQGQITPAINKIFNLEETVEALLELKDRKVIGKNVIRIKNAD
ncbi:MAG: NADPH:quinone oxidoreductase family protein [Cyclobacteriaceae bacterium]